MVSWENVFVEAHHKNPASKMNDADETSIEDIIMVGSNCHSNIHRNRYIDFEDIHKIFK